MIISPESLRRVVSLGITLSAERDMNRLLETILTEAMAITNCDAGTLYLLAEEKLQFKIVRNHTLGIFLGGEGSPVDLPPLEIKESNVAAYVTIHRRMENIADVYESDKFDFTGPKQYDKLTGYRTKSMLVVPLLNNRDEIIGVVQLINATDENKNVIPFSSEFEEIFRSVSSLAAIAVTNMRYMEENRELFQSLVEVLAVAIDERSPYNANHTRNVAELVKGFVEFLNRKSDVKINPDEAEQIIMAAWLHDIGKIITPLEIMDKATRLGILAPVVEMRFETIFAAARVDFLQKKLSETEYEILAQEIETARALCLKANSGAPTSDEEIALLKSYGSRECVSPRGEKFFWLTPEEIECLAIKFGTLTPAERKIMENHVEITSRLLSKIKFSKQYSEVPSFAADHHEKLNGKGYPFGKSETELPLGTRILTILDVFEALTAKDRPYKKPMPLEKVFAILDDMTQKGEVDPTLTAWLKKWKM